MWCIGVQVKAEQLAPQGLGEADISGTFDHTEMSNWTTGCTQHKE